MKQKLTIFVTLLILSGLTLAGSQMGSVNASRLSDPGQIAQADQQMFDNISQYIEQKRQSDNIPGVAVAIVKGNQTVFAQGFGLRDIENNLPVTPETLFHIGSTTKSMTALLVGKLVDEGKLTWDTPAVTIYPQFKLSDDQSTQQVTLRHLLSMTSGIPASMEDDFDLENSTAEDLFTYIQDQPLDGAPSEKFSYSNINYALAGYLAVLADDNSKFGTLYQGYADLLKSKILTPIGMTNAFVLYSEVKNNPNYGKSYILEDGSPVEAEPEDMDGDALAPSGVLKANVQEMALFISTQLKQGQAPNGTQVVSSKNVTETWQTAPGSGNYALGWDRGERYKDYQIISHEGTYDNYLGIIGFVPALDMGFVIFVNSEEAGDSLISEAPQYIIDQFASATNRKVYLPVLLKQ